MISAIALILLGSGPVEPIAPKAPLPPEVKAPSSPSAPPLEQAKPTKGEAANESPLVPPALSKKGLCGELHKTGKELAQARKKLEDDRRALDADRLSVEKLKAEIADARIQLRAETERLEALLAKRTESPLPEADKQAAPSERPKPTPSIAKPQDLDSLAKTMKSMKPETAAALLTKSEPALGAGVLRRMRPADAGAILDRIRPDFAAELLALMATLPSTAPNKGGRL